MRIGVTGATGFIGQYLLRDYHDQYDFVAAKVLFGREGVSTLECYLPNIKLTSDVFEACYQLGIKNVIYSSSRSVCSNISNQEIVYEDDYPHVTSGYGVTKLCGETIAQYYNSQVDMGIKSFRFTDVTGISRDGTMINPFFNAVLQKCILKQPVCVYGTGSAKRDIIYIKDVTRALIEGLKHEKGGVYNICTGCNVSNLEIAEAFCDVFDNKSGIVFESDKLEGGTSFWLNGEKAEKDFGFVAEYDLTKIVLDIYNEIIERVK